jgi:hypothetical protein
MAMNESEKKESTENEADFTVRELLDEAIEDESWGGSEAARETTCKVLYALLPTM